MLGPVSTAIKKVEGENFSVSDIDEVLKEMKKCVIEAISFFPSNLQSRLKDVLNVRAEFIRHPSHLAARLLNPRYRCDGMTNEEVQIAMIFIEQFGELLNIDKVNLLTDLANYRIKNEWAKRTVWQTANELLPTVWWKAFFAGKKLAIIAIDF